MTQTRNGSIGERLEERRAALFVGRAAELARVAELLEPRGEKRFLYFMGPGGIGKTQILHAAARLARAGGYAVTRIDGRDRAWAEEELIAAFEKVGGGGAPHLILLDTFEAIGHLETAVRERCLPRLPDRSRVIAAGRIRLNATWREDPGWWALAETIQVGPMSAGETERLFLARGLTADRVAGARHLRGHPLSIALLADVLAFGGDDRGAGDPLLPQLVDRLMAGVSPDARRALEAASLALHLDRQLLACMLGVDDARGEYDELRRWSFVEERGARVVVHDVVRDAVAADLTWRDGTRSAELCRRAGRWYLERLEGTRGGTEFAEIMRDAVHLITHAQNVPSDPRRREQLLVVPFWPAAWPEVEAMVLRHEGERSLVSLRHWREVGAPIWICRDEAERVRGFACVLDLSAFSEEQAAADPGVLPLWRHWRDAGVFRAGRTRYMRHWMSDEGHHGTCPVQTALFIHLTLLIAGPDTAAGAQVLLDPENWHRFETDFTPRHRPALDFAVDHRRFGVIERDFLSESSQEYCCRFLAWAIELWTAAARSPAAAGRQSAELARPEFERIVRDALRVSDRPDLLGASDLRRLRCLGAVDGAAASAVGRALRDRLLEECRQLFASPRDAVLLEVMERTYVRRGGKQEAIAAELHLSYSTYRRHLATATRRLIDALWAREREPG